MVIVRKRDDISYANQAAKSLFDFSNSFLAEKLFYVVETASEEKEDDSRSMKS